jgi:hypothetical protein
MVPPNRKGILGETEMAKELPKAAALVKLPVETYGDHPEVRFGKTDKVVKLAFPIGAKEPTGVLFVAKNGKVFLADVSRYPAEIKGVLLFHGSKQKLGDEYADLDSEDDCLEAARALDARLAEGKWTADREGFAGVSILMRAIMKVFGKTEDEARAFLKDLSKKEKDGLRTCAELKPTIDELEAEKGKGVETKGLIERLTKAPESTPAQPQA